MQKVLITGALGFIGSYLTKYILDNHSETSVIAIGRNSNQRKLQRLSSHINDRRLQMVYTDFAKNSMTEYFDGVDYCFHLGAKTFVDHSIRDPLPFIESNIIGTYNMLEAARKCRTLKGYFQVSTDEVYGPCLGEPFREDAQPNPSSPYSASKMAADSLAISYYHTYKLPIIITRTENNYGPFQGPEKVMPVFVKKALAGEPLPVYGDGLHRRRWLHVEDHCRAFLYLMWQGKSGEIYHVAGEEELTNIALAKKIAKILNVPEKIEFIPDHNIRPSHDRRYALNVDKLKATGWFPKYDINSGFEEVINWYKNNEWWMK